MKTTLSPEERNTILAALRLFQANRDSGLLSEDILDIATDSGTQQVQSNGEIDGLCERLNTADLRQGAQ